MSVSLTKINPLSNALVSGTTIPVVAPYMVIPAIYIYPLLCLNIRECSPYSDRLCGIVVRVSGYRYRGLGFDSRRYQIFRVVVGLERGPLSLVRSIEELLE